MESIGVANAMDAFEGDHQAAPAGPCLKRLNNRCWLQNATGCSETKEHLPIGPIARYVLEIALNRDADLIRQRKFQRLAGLALANVTGAPLEVVERESHNVAGAHAVCC